MRTRELKRRIPLFPIVPIVPVGLVIGSFILSILAFREARQAHAAAA
jgi:uncharacterized membrane protein